MTDHRTTCLALFIAAKKHKRILPPDMTRRPIEAAIEGYVLGIGCAAFGAMMAYMIFGGPA